MDRSILPQETNGDSSSCSRLPCALGLCPSDSYEFHGLLQRCSFTNSVVHRLLRPCSRSRACTSGWIRLDGSCRKACYFVGPVHPARCKRTLHRWERDQKSLAIRRYLASGRSEWASMIDVQAGVAQGDGTFHLETVGLDEPGPGEVLVAVKASGVCHTDADSLHWGRSLILGHEGAGEVLRFGPGVTHVAPGDRVMLNWAIPCGHCFQCKRGHENICEKRGTVPDRRFHRLTGDTPVGGFPADDIFTTARNTGGAGPGRFNASFSLGTMATHALVPQAAVLPLLEGVPFEVGAILGCAVMTGFGSAVNAAKVEEGTTVVVLGCGGVGLSTIMGALYCKAARVIAIDISPARLELAKQFGATETLLARREDTGLLAAAAEVKRLTGGRGADYAFECTAVPELGAAPLAMIRSAGAAVGVSGIEKVVPIDMELFEWDKLYINPLYGSCRPHRDFPLLMRLYKDGTLPLDRMVTRRYTLEQLPQAFEDLRAGRNAKGVLSFA